MESSDIQEIKQEMIEKDNLPIKAVFNNKICKTSDILFHAFYRKQLKKTNFTIISNNCWGGVVYEHFGLKKQSPTIGSYFFAEEYIRFVSNLDYYLKCDLQFIKVEASKYSDLIKLKKQENVPIGILGDIEIMFLHYHSCDEAKEKWDRRIKRVNRDNLIIKFSEQNLCKYDHLRHFDNLPYKKKIMFTKNNYPQLNSAIQLPFYENKVSLLSDIHEYRFAMRDVLRLINS